MKKLLACALVLLPVLLVGCGGDDDDDNGVTPVQPVIVTASTVASNPGGYNSAIWSTITPKSVAIAGISYAKERPEAYARPAVLADSVAVQAAVYNSRLYLRLQWADTSHHVWRDHFSVRERDSASSWILFTNHALAQVEDGLVVMFKDTAANTWDTWSWRALTTDGLDRAEDGKLDGTTLTRDALGTGTNIAIAVSNANPNGQQPLFVHQTWSSFTDPVLLETQKDTLAANILADAGWQIGDRVPGWRIIDTLPSGAFGSAYEVNADSHYDNADYIAVLNRALNTGHDDDLVMAAGQSYPIRIGVSDNYDIRFTGGSTSQGFTAAFTLRFP
jgi:hypothetical protein